MSGNPKITDDQIVSDSSVLLSLVDTDAGKARKTRLLKAAAFEKLENVVDTVTQSAGSKTTLSSKASNKGEVDNSYEIFSGKNLYINNGISVEALLEMLKNDTKTADASYELYGSTALLKSGYTKDDTTGAFTKTCDALVTQEASQILTSGQSQASSYRMDAIQGITQGFGGLLSEGASTAMTSGQEEEAQSHVDKIQNALDIEKEIPQATCYATDETGNQLLDAEGNPVPKAQSAAIKRAIEDLSSNKYDVTEQGNHFGSTSKPSKNKSVAVEKDADVASLDGFVIDTGNGTSETVGDALKSATVTQRAAIRKNLQKQLVKAKDRLVAKRTEIQQVKQGRTQLLNGLSQGAASALKTQNANNSMQAAQADAQKVVIQNENSTIQSTQQKQNEGISAATKNQTSALDLLRQMYAQLGKRG